MERRAKGIRENPFIQLLTQKQGGVHFAMDMGNVPVCLPAVRLQRS
jgi:hypothetical protein